MEGCSKSIILGGLRGMCALLVFAGAALTGSVATAAPITILSASVASCASDAGSTICNIDSSTGYGTRTVNESDVGTSATTFANWVDTGSGALFDFDFTQIRIGSEQAYAESFGRLRFTALQDTTYAISGLYSVLDVGAPGYVHFQAYLYDEAAGSDLMHDDSQSVSTVNQSFTLGVAGDGDLSNYSVGSLTGNLTAGRTYEFLFSGLFQAFPDADTGATATGCVTFSVGGATTDGSCEVAPIPEPTTMLLLGTGLTVAAAARRYRRVRQA